jgi:hypothetical protein
MSQETYPKARQYFRVETEGFVGWSVAASLQPSSLPGEKKVLK